ncbi:hypothetical protein BDW59DRAFT_141264 [Aspergillus cavernicola]|uniref:Zn(2)-C6 fungal-type domain-containing protein n=1 Tax=Aspergillus cavernicola TaxID=176166 RepID=A0ABR4IRK6_9EURO
MSNNPNNHPNHPNHPHDPNGGPNRQGQYPPPQWNTSQPEENPSGHYPPPTSQYPYPPASYPPPASYAPPAPYPPPAGDHHYPPPPAQYPPQSQYPPQPNMAAVHPPVHVPDGYRLPPPPPAGPYRPDVAYSQQPPPPGAGVVYQAAPRQRTAIACRYCRRRKIRCSGFDSNPEGRCSNCIRFNQPCMFTPVSSQAQAFVPAHAAYPHMRNTQGQGRNGGEPIVLYGAHGQPLPPQQQPQAGSETTLPPPQGMYQHSYSSAPPLASMPPDHRPRRGSSSGFDYPDPTNLAPVTPATSAPYQSRAAPYYPPPQAPLDRRPSPQAAYSYDNRHSSSPHGSPYPPVQPPAQNPNASTPPPTSTPGSVPRNGLNVRDMLNPGENPGRSSTDSDMLNALNRRGLGQ